jgi:CzcA family heavy metal efflux pump
MLNNVIQLSIKNRWLVSFLGIVLLVYGIFVASRTPVDVFPDFAPVQVVVQTEAPGFAPEEVESVVTLPIESALNGTANVKLVRSISTVGLSVVTLIFEDGTNVFTARQLVTEKLQSVNLPEGIEEPMLAPITTAVGDVIRLGLITDGKISLMDLRTLCDWTIRPRLMAISGVANVVTYGGEVKQYQVLVDPNKLQDLKLTLSEVVEATRKSNANAPGGILRTTEKEYLIRGIGRIKSVDEINQQVVASRDGTPIVLGQVAQVQIGSAFKIGDALVNGKHGVIMTVTKQPWANTLATTYVIENALKDLKQTFPAGVDIIPTFRQADFIEVAVHNVLEALIIGGILVTMILFIFLQNWRTAFISLTAIPLSLLAAVIALNWQGGTINTMTLGGLAIAIGEVVDDAIIDVENVYRRLRENKLAGSPKHPIEVVYDASREIRTSVVYATWIVALVFLPIFSLGGLEGKIFTPLAFSYIVAILASLGVALTITPALCYMLLARQESLPEQETRVVHWLKSQYRKLLNTSLSQPKLVTATALILFLVSLIPLVFIGQTFLPEFDESNLIVAANAIPGTSLNITTQTGQTLTQHLMEHKQVIAVGQRAGRAEGSDDYGGSNFSEFDIRLKESDHEGKGIIEHVREDFSKVPGLVINLGSYIAHRMDHTLSGVNAAIAIKIFGPELPVLHQKAAEIESVMRSISGAVDAQVEAIIPIPQIGIHVDRAAAARYGLGAGDLADTIETAFKGVSVSQVLEGQKKFDLFVWFQPQYRQNVEVIQQTLVDTATGTKVPIGSVAQVVYETSPNMIRHENFSRQVVVQANVSGRDLGSVIQEARAKIAKQVKLPPGYYVVYGGQFEAQEKATQQLVLLSMGAIIAIFVLLFMAFRSGWAAGLVMANLPLALIGGIWAIYLSGGVLSVGSLVGFITLFGISTRNGIMLVSHFNHLLGEGRPFDSVLLEGSMDRLVPVLMTALTAALGVLPIAVLGGAGRELEQPLAIVILGGMFTSTTLTLVVIPALFKLFGHKALHSVSLDDES